MISGCTRSWMIWKWKAGDTWKLTLASPICAFLWATFPSPRLCVVCDTCFGFIYLFVFIKSSLILAYIFGSRLYWIPDTNVNLFRKKLEILAFQRFSMRRIACHYLSLFLFLSIFPPLTWDQTFVASTISWPLFCISIILFLFCYCCDGVCHQLAFRVIEK